MTSSCPQYFDSKIEYADSSTIYIVVFVRCASSWIAWTFTLPKPFLTQAPA